MKAPAGPLRQLVFTSLELDFDAVNAQYQAIICMITLASRT